MLRPVDQSLKGATSDLISAVGGQGAATGFCRINRQQALSEYANDDHPAWMPIDVVRDLEKVTKGQPGHPNVTRELARQAGYALFRLPAAKPDELTWLAHLRACAKEANDVICALTQSIEDNKVEQSEATEVRVQIAQAIAALVDLDAALTGVEDTS